MQFTFFNINLQSGGAERQISNMMKWLSKHNHSVQLITFYPENNPAYELPDNVEMISLMQSADKTNLFVKFFKIFILAFRLKSIVNKHGYKSILSFNHRPNYINVLSQLFLGSKHKVVLFEQIFPSRQYSRLSIKGLINWYLTYFLYNKALHIIPNSKDIGIDLIQNFNVSPQKITAIYNPVDIDSIANSASIQNVQHNYFLKQHKEKFKFIAIGRLSFQKNYELMIHSFKQSGLMENAILIIIGIGEDEQKIKSLITALGLYHNVFLLGHTYNPFYILSKADCYLLSSRFEGFPNSLLEAISLGVPSIAVDCKSGPREIYEFPLQKELTEEFVITASGILVQNFNQNAFSSAMQLLYTDTELRHTISENSRKRILNFSIDKSMLEHTDLLEKIVND